MLNSITSNIDAILIPKVSEQQHIERLYTENLVNKAIPIWAMIETAKGIINVNQIASSPLIEALVFGSNDLTKDIKALHTAYRYVHLLYLYHTKTHFKCMHIYIHEGNHYYTLCPVL